MPLFLAQPCEYYRIEKKERNFTKWGVNVSPSMNGNAEGCKD